MSTGYEWDYASGLLSYFPHGTMVVIIIEWTSIAACLRVIQQKSFKILPPGKFHCKEG